MYLAQSIFDLIESLPNARRPQTLEKIAEALVTSIFENTNQWYHDHHDYRPENLPVTPEINVLMRNASKGELKDVYYLVYGRETTLEDYIPF